MFRKMHGRIFPVNLRRDMPLRFSQAVFSPLSLYMYDVGIFEVLTALFLTENLDPTGEPVDGGLTSKLVDFRRDSIWPWSFSTLGLTDGLHCFLSRWGFIKCGNQGSLRHVIQCLLINCRGPVQ